MLAIGETAPDFELLDQDGNPFKLSDLRGTRVILFFFPRAATPGCTKQACGLRDNFPTIEANNATVIGIGPDEPAKMAAWKADQNLPFTVLSDPEAEVATRYNAYGEKSMYGRKYMGFIRSHFVIDADGKFEDVQVKISPAKSIEKAVKTIAR